MECRSNSIYTKYFCGHLVLYLAILIALAPEEVMIFFVFGRALRLIQHPTLLVIMHSTGMTIPILHRYMQVEATSDGKLAAVVVWWELHMTKQGGLVLSTAPSWIQRDPMPKALPPYPISIHVLRIDMFPWLHFLQVDRLALVQMRQQLVLLFIAIASMPVIPAFFPDHNTFSALLTQQSCTFWSAKGI